MSTALTAKNLTVEFGRFKALDNISFELPVESFLSVAGPNGGGKTTLLKVILGLEQSTGGSVEVLGYAPGKVPRDMICYVPQIKTLDRTFPATALELVTSGLTGRWPVISNHSTREKAMSAMQKAGVERLADRQISKLSGGELQRVFLARALARRPRMLVLDEPATGIDSTGSADLNKLLENYKAESGATIVMVTHDWDAVLYHSDYVLLLNGAAVCFDKPEIALRDNNMRVAFGHVGHGHTMITGDKCHG